MSQLSLNPYSNPVNNCGFDPLSGFNFDVFVTNNSGGRVFFGKFQSLTLSIRNATETYLELGQRIPKYLDGEIQIAWVLEQGLIDMSFIKRTFGVEEISRCQYIGAGPRFHITFDANAADYGLNSDIIRGRDFTTRTSNDPAGTPSDKGRYEIIRCKVDSVSLGIMPGRRVAAVRWEGVAEGIKFSAASEQAVSTVRPTSTVRVVTPVGEPTVVR